MAAFEFEFESFESFEWRRPCAELLEDPPAVGPGSHGSILGLSGSGKAQSSRRLRHKVRKHKTQNINLVFFVYVHFIVMVCCEKCDHSVCQDRLGTKHTQKAKRRTSCFRSLSRFLVGVL
jgi:hypothetical protein